jgi:hypothetical protein
MVRGRSSDNIDKERRHIGDGSRPSLVTFLPLQIQPAANSALCTETRFHAYLAITLLEAKVLWIVVKFDRIVR